MEKLVVTLDGPAGSGKGTIARHLAEKFTFAYLETGLLYRFLGAIVLQEKIPIVAHDVIIAQAQRIRYEDIVSLSLSLVEKNRLQNEEIAEMASQVAVIPQVREILTHLQKEFIQKVSEPYKGVILDGRDIGTVVCPEAPCKLFVTADSAVRAARRIQQEGRREEKEQMQQRILHRDQRDQTRKTAPLGPARDAYVIDTTDLSVLDACQQAESHVKRFL